MTPAHGGREGPEEPVRDFSVPALAPSGTVGAMGIRTQSPARLWVIRARESPTAVIFRRGPTRQVQLIRWNTETDEFEAGQWFKGRIYERRCDLSPDGTLLIYFAAKHRPPLGSWTAISKPPYFTALALWPKGDCWNGGGWFVDDRKIRLNHPAFQAQLHPDFKPGPVQVVGFAQYGGEDASVTAVTEPRDGWERQADGASQSRGGVRGWTIDPPECWTKPRPGKPGFVLERALRGIGGSNVPWYQVAYRVRSAAGECIIDLGLLDWADWDTRGRLVFAREGCLFRQRVEKARIDEARQLADFNDAKFTNVPPPAWACRW